MRVSNRWSRVAVLCCGVLPAAGAQVAPPGQGLPTLPKPSLPQPTLPSTTIAVPTPTFAHAGIDRTFLALAGVGGVQVAGTRCGSPGKPCWRLTDTYSVIVNGQVSPGSSCSKLAEVGEGYQEGRTIAFSGRLDCSLAAGPTLAQGAPVSVALSRPALSGGTLGTTRQYTAFRCSPQIAQVSGAGGTSFVIAGTGLGSTQPGATRAVRVSDVAAGRPPIAMPVSQVVDRPDGSVQATLSHPDLSRKTLGFEVELQCPGAAHPSGSFVLFENNRPNPTTRRTASRELRLPGADGANAALLIGGAPRLWINTANQPVPAGGATFLVGDSGSLDVDVVNYGPAVNSLGLEITVSGSLRLGGTLGQPRLPTLRPMGSTDNSNPAGLACATQTPSRYLCQIASLPGGGSYYQLLTAIRPVGATSGSGTITFHTFGATATHQFTPVTVPVVFDPANTADRSVSGVFLASAVVPGQDYSAAQFPALTGHRIGATFANAGPANIAGPVNLLLTVHHPQAGGPYWRLAAVEPLPAGCEVTGSLPTQLVLLCAKAVTVPAGQGIAFEVPIRIAHLAGAGTTSAWPACSPACLPNELRVSVAIHSQPGTPWRDPDQTNDSSPPRVYDGATGQIVSSSHALRLCSGSWAVSGANANGTFAALRCVP